MNEFFEFGSLRKGFDLYNLSIFIFVFGGWGFFVVLGSEYGYFVDRKMLGNQLKGRQILGYKLIDI